MGRRQERLEIHGHYSRSATLAGQPDDAAGVKYNSAMSRDVFHRACRNQPFDAGDAVRIIDGPLANLTGAFVRAAAPPRWTARV